MSQFILLAVFALSLFCSACSESPRERAKGEPDQISIQLKWRHQAQFAGFYVAKEKGYYQEENLEVSFIEGGKNIDQQQQLLTGAADFSIIPAEPLLLNNPNSEMVAIAVIYQRSPLMFVSHKNRGINQPADFKGKTIALGGLETGGFRDAVLQFNALAANTGSFTPGSMKVVPYDYDYTEFLSGNADITPSYIVGGFNKIKDKGEFNLIWPGDYGVNYYSDTLVTTSKTITNMPDLVLRFLKATLKGWREAIGNPNEAVDITMQYATIQDKQVQQSMMDAQIPLVHAGSQPIGWMDGHIWQAMYDSMDNQDVITTPLTDLSTVYTMKFLKQIYPDFKQ